MKRVLLLVFILSVYFCGNLPVVEENLRSNVVKTAEKFLGTPYRTGGTEESGFDCSGFARYVMNQNNIDISRSSRTQISDGVKLSIQNVKPGDLLIFKGGNRKSKRAGHSAIVHHVSDDGTVYFIHSALRKGITIDNLNESYYRRRFLEARDVISQALEVD